MSIQRWYLVLGTLLVLAFASLSLAQSTPIVTITNGSGDWTPNEQNVRVSWSSENFNNTPVVTSISLFKSTGEIFSFWSSGIIPGNFRSGTKTFNLTTTGSQTTIRLAGQSTGLTVPTGSYRFFINMVDNSTRPTLEAENYSPFFNILPNLSCPITVTKSGQGTVTGGTSVPVGQAPNIFFSPSSGYQTTAFQKCINNVCTNVAPVPASPKALDRCVANAAGTAGVPLSAHITFGTPGCPLNIAKSPVGGGTLSTPGLVNGKIPAGGSVSITATANPGFTFRDFYSQGQTKRENPVTVTCPTGSTATQNVTAFFVAGTCPVTGTAGAGGTISPTTGTKNVGQTQSFTARANSGYVIDTMTVNGVSVPGVYGQTATSSPAVTCAAPNAIEGRATFKLLTGCPLTTYNFNPEGGSINPIPGTTYYIPSNSAADISVKAKEGWIIDYFRFGNNDALPLAPGATEASARISCGTGNQAKMASVKFKPGDWKINVERVGGGLGTYEPYYNPINVPFSSDKQSVKIQAGGSSYISKILLDNVPLNYSGDDQDQNDDWFVDSVTVDIGRGGKNVRNLKIFFEKKTCQLVSFVSSKGNVTGGSVVPNGTRIMDLGTDFKLQTQATYGFRFDKFVVKYYSIKNGDFVLGQTFESYQDTFTGSCSLPKEEYEAVFVPVGGGCPVRVREISDKGGTIFPGNSLINPGDQQEYNIYPEDKYYINSIYLNKRRINITDKENMTVKINCSVDPMKQIVYNLDAFFYEKQDEGLINKVKHSFLDTPVGQVASVWQAFGKLPDRVFGGMWSWLK